ncbi:MAG: hypothetical protein AAF824_02570 [Bacteroidota bacterium]
MYKYKIHEYIREMSADFQQLAWGWLILELDMSREQLVQKMLLKEGGDHDEGFTEEELSIICIVLNRIRPYKHRLRLEDLIA